MPSKLPEDPSNLNILLTTTKKEMIYNIPVNTRWYPLIPVDTRNTRNTRKYPRVKEIPGNTRSHISTLLPDPNPTCYPVFCPIPDPTPYWKTLPAGHCLPPCPPKKRKTRKQDAELISNLDFGDHLVILWWTSWGPLGHHLNITWWP